MAKLWLQSKQFADHREHGFCAQDGLLCCLGLKGGYTIVIPEDEKLHQKLLHLHYDLPLAERLGMFWIVKTLSSRYYWRGTQNDFKLYCKHYTFYQAKKVSTQVL